MCVCLFVRWVLRVQVGAAAEQGAAREERGVPAAAASCC